MSESDALLGNDLITMLGLTVKSNGRVDTSWGDKTPKGLGATVRRVVNDSQPAEPDLLEAAEVVSEWFERFGVVQGESDQAHADRMMRTKFRAAIERARPE